jgi:ubiquinone/menaquinone biosynthesis C-methylase UbiE
MEGVHERLIGAYDRAAPSYDVAGFTWFEPFGKRLAELVLLGPGGRVLDVACGAGASLLPAARRVGPTGQAVGVDLAPGMVVRAQIAAREAGLEQVRAEVLDATELPFEDATFDAVLCGFGLPAVADPDAALAEGRRVLTPRGSLGVSAWENLLDDRWHWEQRLIEELAAEVPPELIATVGRMSERFNEEHKLRAALEAAGFSDVAVERMVVERTYADADGWWDWIWSYGFRAFVEALPEPARERFRAAGFERLADAGRRERSRQFVALLATARVAG